MELRRQGSSHGPRRPPRVARAPDVPPVPDGAHEGGPPRVSRLFARPAPLGKPILARGGGLAAPPAGGALRPGLPRRGGGVLPALADRDASLARVRAGGSAPARRSAAYARPHRPRRLPRAASGGSPGTLPALLRAQLPLPDRRLPRAHQRRSLRPPGRAAFRRHRGCDAPPAGAARGPLREGARRVAGPAAAGARRGLWHRPSVEHARRCPARRGEAVRRGSVAALHRPCALVVAADSIQLGDAPELEREILGFPSRFHEPFYTSYVKDELAARISEAGLRATSAQLAFLTKLVFAEKPAPGPASPMSAR